MPVGHHPGVVDVVVWFGGNPPKHADFGVQQRCAWARKRSNWWGEVVVRGSEWVCGEVG